LTINGTMNYEHSPTPSWPKVLLFIVAMATESARSTLSFGQQKLMET